MEKLIKKGAEADLYLGEWYGLKAVFKIRKPKPYRNKELDDLLRERRTVREALFLTSAKEYGVITPLVYFVDIKKAEIIMQYLNGKVLRDILLANISLDKRLRLCEELGKILAKLHNNSLIHGDPTTSNFILVNGKLAVIDFGLSFISNRVEDRAVDLHLIREIMSSVHSTIFNNAFESLLDGYSSLVGNEAKKVVETVADIERRGRYARVV
jgi:TP53 regulating kinase-like protein